MGNLLDTPITEKDTHEGSTSDISYAVSSMQGWRVNMEDAHISETRLYASLLNGGGVYEKLELPNHYLFGVFDGHGGTFAAIYSAGNLCRVLSRQEKFVEYAKQAPDQRKVKLLEEALHQAFIEVDREILLFARGEKPADAYKPYHDGEQVRTPPVQNPDDNNNASVSSDNDPSLPAQSDESGTTAIVVLVTPTCVLCANAGDSRSVFSKDGHRVAPLSYDHKPDDEEEERRIRAAGNYVAAGRVDGDLAVSRGLGDFRFKSEPVVRRAVNKYEVANPGSKTHDTIVFPDDQAVSPAPDVITQMRKPADEFIVIACDGIWDVMDNQACVASVAELFSVGESNVGLICEEIMDMCLEKGSKDNMSVILLKFEAQKVGVGGGVMQRRSVREKIREKMEQEVASATHPSAT